MLERVSKGPRNVRDVPTLIMEAENFLTWVKAQGVRVPAENWIVRTMRGYAKMAGIEGDELQKVYVKAFPNTGELQYNLADFLQLNAIHMHIGKQDSAVLADKLSSVVKGPNSLLDENGRNTASRNIRFELFLTSKLNSHGYEALLRKANPDIFAKWHRDISFGIECKRVYSGKTIDSLIGDAEVQFRDRPGNAGLNANVLALDVTRAVTDGKLHISGSPVTAARKVAGILEVVAEPIIAQLQAQKYPNIDAIILCYIDHVQPDIDKSFTLHGLTQLLVLDNPKAPRVRKRYALNALKHLANSNIDL